MAGELAHLNDGIKSGRPRIFKSVDEMQDRIDEYFDYCDNRTRQVYSKKADDVIEIMDPAPYTMSGLALALGMSRVALIDYKTRIDDNGKDFLATINSAKSRVEADIDERLSDKETFTPGLIFNAKNNFSWQDTSKVEGTQEIIVTTRRHKNSAVKNP